MSPKYKLVYFNARGRAETIRYIFAVAKVKYEDVRVESEKWAEFKDKTPWKMLPLLVMDKRQVGESNVICRYLAKEFGLAGKNAIETAFVDSAAETVTNIREKLLSIVVPKPGVDQEVELIKFKDEYLPDYLGKLDGFMASNGGDFLAGKKLSWADLHFHAVLEIVEKFAPECLENNPKLKTLRQKVADEPELAEWLKNRTQTEH